MEAATMNPELMLSEDGSHTLRVESLNENYHSHKGALRESRHVFIKHGLEFMAEQEELRILEVGFGTGLNALLAALEGGVQKRTYHTLETFPLDWKLVEQLNYVELIGSENAKEIFEALHAAPWEESVKLSPVFSFQKVKCGIQHYRPSEGYDLVFYDAFAPHAQPELWEPAIWPHLFSIMNAGGVLVTYCAKGQVKRDMKAAGFTIEELPGPPGKRQMTRALKP